MIRKALVGAAVVLSLSAIAAGSALVWAHVNIRGERAPLPSPEAFAHSRVADTPVRISFVNSASQPMPRGAVLDPRLDPRSDEGYVMSHPSFVLEWEDGRILLVDAGMTRDGAREFGRPIEWIGGEPIRAHGSVAEQLGDARDRVQAVLFTHLHEDHVGGMTELCAGRRNPLRVPLSPAQAERPNYTTRPGLRVLRQASCSRPEVLADSSPAAVPGFDGVSVLRAAGHTPGSQVVVARVRGAAAAHVLVGDIANHIDGINEDLPKPLFYRLLVVPEDNEWLGRWRRFLRDLRDRHGAVLLLAHDQRNLEGSGIPRFGAPVPDA